MEKEVTTWRDSQCPHSLDLSLRFDRSGRRWEIISTSGGNCKQYTTSGAKCQIRRQGRFPNLPQGDMRRMTVRTSGLDWASLLTDF